MPRHSLKGRKAILTLLSSGKKFSSSLLTINWSQEMAESKAGYQTVFVVSSRAGGAVERNRIRRWLREDFRKLQADREIKGAFVIRFKGEAELIDHKSLGENLEKLYRKIEADE